MSQALTLEPVEARVLGVLVEKEKTVPDTYPMSLNALTNGCNQKNNRDPVTHFTETEVQAAIDRLKSLSLVIESSGARVTRFSHNIDRVLRIPSQSVAIVATLMLRGALTSGELRINTERLHRFADISSVEAFLEELATRPEAQGGALVIKLARQPGAREQRWAHLLCGAPSIAVQDEVAAPAQGELAEMRAEIQRLSAQVEQLRVDVAQLRAERSS